MKRIVRGFKALVDVFGWQFALAIAVLLGLLVWAVFHVHGGLFGVLALVLALLAIRAHDIGSAIEESKAANEHEAGYDALAQYRTPYAPPSRVLGPNHDGSEL